MFKSKNLLLGAAVGALVCFSAASSRALPFDINLSFGAGISASQQTIFSQAEAFWENVLTGTIADDLSTGPAGPHVLDVLAQGAAIDGVGGVLGAAGPSGPRDTSAGTGFSYSLNGLMTFDTADLASLEASGRLLDVVKHEMAHTIGFGTLWDENGLYVNGSGQYTGALALAQCIVEFPAACAPGATFIPIEIGNPNPGSNDSHWQESLFGTELMTPAIGSTTFLSQMTVCSFRDLGFETTGTCGAVVTPPPPPRISEPGTLAPIYGLALAGLAVAARRRKRS